MYNGSVWFDKYGNHLRNKTWYDKDTIERQNFIFKDDLIFVKMYRNYVIWESLNNQREYISFTRDLLKFLPRLDNTGEKKLKVSGFFTFRNNGGRTGLIPTTFEFEDYTSRGK